MLSIRLDKDLEKRLTNLAKKTGRTKSYYATKALQEFIEDKEDYFLAVRALENDDGTRTTLEAVMKQFKLKPKKKARAKTN